MSKIRTCLLPIAIGIQRSTLSKPGTPRFILDCRLRILDFDTSFRISYHRPLRRSVHRSNRFSAIIEQSAKIAMFCKYFNQRLLKSSAVKSTIFTQ